MTKTRIFLGATAGLALLLGASLLLTPREVRVVRSAPVAAPPADILALAASGDGYQAFNPYRTADPDLRIQTFGPASGVGSGFRFEGRDGSGTQTVEFVSADRVGYAIDLGVLGRPKQSILALAAPRGSTVTWEMRADLGYNPVARMMGLFLEGMVGPTLEQGLANLDAAFSAS